MRLERRDLLGLLGATAAVGTAGCLDSVGLGGDDLPASTRWVPMIDGEAMYVSVDVAGLAELEDREDDDPVDEVEDPMLSVPLLGAIAAGLASIELAPTGLAALAEPGEDEFETDVEEQIVVPDAIVLRGEIDVDEVHDTLIDEPEEDGFVESFDRIDEIDDVDVYESESGDTTLAVDGDAIVVATETSMDDVDAGSTEILTEVIETRAGDRERASEASDDFAWVLDHVAGGHVTLAVTGDFDDTDEAEFDLFDGATAIGGSLTLEDDGASGDLAAIYDELDEETADRLESDLGASAADASVDVDDDRVSAEATWDEDPLD